MRNSQRWASVALFLVIVLVIVPAAIAASGKPLSITLTVPGAARPRPLNGADDDRVLGVCLERMLFRRLRPAERA